MFGQQNQVNVGGKVFTITKQIGQGTQGSVFKGRSNQGEEVAIKYQGAISDTEYEILQNLAQNPKANIIGIRGVQRDISGKIVIVMELADNELYKYMTENLEFRTLSKDQKNQIFYQMVQAVKELHELGYFHRDLKPENYVVFKKDANGYVKTKLIDLGLCKQKQNSNKIMMTQNVGTPYYMAPEIINGSLFYDQTVDSWALGCIWFELMTDSPFFNGNNQDQLFYNIRNANQFQIDQKIQSQQIFNENEKLLLKSLIQKDANRRISVKELAQKLQQNQNYNNQANPNFNNNQNVNVFKTPISQFPQFQNLNQFNQPTNFQQNQNKFQPPVQQVQPVQPVQQVQQVQQIQPVQLVQQVQPVQQVQQVQPQQNFNQMNDWKQKQQQQMQQEYEQKLKTEFEQQRQIEIEKVRKEEEEKQKLKLLEEQKRQEEQNQVKLKQLEEELRKKNEEEQKKIELDKKRLEQLKIEQEMKIQLQLEEQKKRNEEEQKRKEEEMQRQNELKLQMELVQKEQELQRKIAEQLQQEYLIKYNQELQQKQQQERYEKEKNFSETKNQVKKLMKNSKEIIEKFISSLEEKSQEKFISESKSIVPKIYKEFQDMTQNIVNQFKSKITQIEEKENAIQQMDDFEQLSQVQEMNTQLSQYNQKIAQEQINVLNGITQKYNELITQLMNQKQLKEQLENQQKQQVNQRQQLQVQYQSYNQQIKVLKSNFENQKINSQQLITQLNNYEILIQSKQINDKLESLNQQADQCEQLEKQFNNQEIQIQLIKYQQMNSQLIGIIEELKQLINQQQQMNLNAQNVLQNLKTQINEKIQQFQDQVLTFGQCNQKHLKDYEQLFQLLVKLQSQGSSLLIQQKVNQYKEQVLVMEGQLKQFERSLSQLQQNFNQNMMMQCQQLIKDLNNKQNELSNQDTKIIQLNQQLGRIINQQNQILQLKEENKKKFAQWDQQQQTLYMQFHNFSNFSGEIKQQVDLLLKSFTNLKNEFQMALVQLDSQKQETEEQLRKYIDDNQRVSNNFMQKFEEKKSTAQALLQRILEIQAIQDEKQKLFNQFNVQCNQVKQMFKQFKLENSFEVFHQIRQFPCQQQMEQCYKYFQECEEKQNENQNLYINITKCLEGKNSFLNQKNKVRDDLNNLYNKSVEAIKDLKQFYNQSIKPYYKENFDQIEQEDDQHFQNLKKCKEIQNRVENLSQDNSDQFQKTLNGQINNQDFIDKVRKDIEQLTNHQNQLQQINIKEIQQFNQQLPNKINSWFIQMLLITVIQSYQKQALIKRKFSKVEEKGNDEQRKQFLDEQSRIKELMLKCQSYLDSKQFNELKLEELIENQRQIKESVEKELGEIKTKNRVKLRGSVKNQEVIKDIIDLTQVQEFQKTFYFNKLQSLYIK